MLMKYHQLPSSFKKRNNSLKKTITYLPNAPVSLNCQLFARSPRRFFSALHNTAGARAACVVTRPTQLMSSPRASGADAPPPAIQDYFLSVPKSSVEYSHYELPANPMAPKGGMLLHVQAMGFIYIRGLLL